MSKITPNNRCELLINDFITLAKEHLLTLKGQAICLSQNATGAKIPSVANWKGYVCDPEQPAAPTTFAEIVKPDFQSQNDLTDLEIEYYTNGQTQVYGTAYSTDVLNAPIYGGKSSNRNETPNTSFIASGIEAREVAEAYLGRTMTDEEWNILISLTFAEAGRNQTEEAHVAGVILNRVRNKFGGGNTVRDIAWQPSQFEAVTGSRVNGFKPSRWFLQGPPRNSEISIYGAIKQILPTVDKRFIYFTANNPCLYVRCDTNGNIILQNGLPIGIEGRRYSFLLTLQNKASKKIVGSTIFSY